MREMMETEHALRMSQAAASTANLWTFFISYCVSVLNKYCNPTGVGERFFGRNG